MSPNLPAAVGDTVFTERPAIAAALRASRLFDGVSEEDWTELESRCFMAYAEKGDVIWPIGCPSSFAGTVASGIVRLLGKGRHASDVLIELMGPGASFGLLAMVDDVPFHLEAEAVTNVWYLKMPMRVLRPLYDRSSATRDGIVRNLGGRIRHAHKHMCAFASDRSEPRLAVCLSMLSSAGLAHEHPEITVFELAAAAGVGSELAAKILAQWERHGVVSLKRNLVRVISTQNLASLPSASER